MKKRFLVIAIFTMIFMLISSVAVMLYLDIKQGKTEGLAFAKQHDQQACVSEVMTGTRVCTGFSCFLNNRYFFQTCINKAAASTALCRNVPVVANLFQFEMWKKQQCKKAGRTDRTCHHIWQKVRNSCKQWREVKKP